MKKSILAFVFLLIGGMAAQAQVRATWGLRAGLNASTWKGETMQSLSSLLDATNGNVTTTGRFGHHGGVYSAIYFGERFAIEPGLQYSLKGTELNGRFTGSSAITELLNANARFRVNSHYIEMPVLAKVYVTEGLHLFAGPQVGYLLSNQTLARVSVLGFAGYNRTFDFTNSFQRWDVAGVAGIGYKFDNGVNLMAAYDHGFQRIDKNSRFDTFNRALKFSLGYEF